MNILQYSVLKRQCSYMLLVDSGNIWESQKKKQLLTVSLSYVLIIVLSCDISVLAIQ